MIETKKRITIVVCINATLTVDADIVDGEVNVVKVVQASGLPSPREVMDALSADEGLSELDAEYEKAGGVLP